MVDKSAGVGGGRWRDRALAALHALPSGRAESEAVLLEEVAIGFADRFAPADRAYRGARPCWHEAVRDAVAGLRGDGLVRGAESPELTAAGARAARGAVRRARAEPRPPAAPAEGPLPLVSPSVIAAPLRAAEARSRWASPRDDDVPVPVMAEINLRFAGGRGRGVRPAGPAVAARHRRRRPAHGRGPVRHRRAVDAPGGAAGRRPTPSRSPGRGAASTGSGRTSRCSCTSTPRA